MNSGKINWSKVIQRLIALTVIWAGCAVIAANATLYHSRRNQELGSLRETPNSNTIVHRAGPIREDRVWINVKEFAGATGDGTTDDTAKVNSAITAAAGGVVYFPKGTYIVSKLLSPAPRTRIVGDGKGISILKRKNLTNDSYILYLSSHGSSLSGITLDGNRAKNPGITGGEIVVEGDDVELHDFEVVNSTWISIQVQAKRTRIRDCNLIGSGSATEGAVTGIWMATQATTDTVIEGCTMSDYRWGAIFAGGTGANAASRIRIINNTFSGNHRQNTNTGGGQVAFGGPGGHLLMGNTFIVGDGLEATLTSGIEANAGAIIVGNFFDGGGVHIDGIVLQIGSHYSVSGNQIRGFRGSGVLINNSVTDITITTNDLNGNGTPIADGSKTSEKVIIANLPVATGDKDRRNDWWLQRQGRPVRSR
ncbi:MAG TPA: glycosyl hydrolase family 28-related protein [Pyrinomonadaceae bacterium]|nr:glycosyl hydrolase family 28-related protein [Pyrinomonadaceae bacterium]